MSACSVACSVGGSWSWKLEIEGKSIEYSVEGKSSTVEETGRQNIIIADAKNSVMV